MNLINCLSLLIIFGSAIFAISYKKIDLPRYFDLIIFGIAVGALALFINTVLGSDMNGQYRNAEILFRAFFAGATIAFVRREYKRGV